MAFSMRKVPWHAKQSPNEPLGNPTGDGRPDFAESVRTPGIDRWQPKGRFGAKSYYRLHTICEKWHTPNPNPMRALPWEI